MANATVTHTLANGAVSDAAQVNTNFSDVLNFLNSTGVHVYQAGTIATAAVADGAVTTPKLGTALAAQLGVTGAGTVVRRGYTSIATEQTTTSTSFTDLSTPDTVSNVVVPTGGLLRISYRALWKLTGATLPGQAAIFIGSNQLKVFAANQAPSTAAASLSQLGVNWGIVLTGTAVLESSPSNSSDASFVTTGMSSRMPTFQVAPGTYDVGIKFLVQDGTLSVKERLLHVESIGFA